MSATGATAVIPATPDVRVLGEDRPMRFTQAEKKGFFSKLFGS